MAFVMMPMVTVVNLFVNFSEMSSPRTALERFNWPEVVLQIGLLALGYYAIITSVKTIMLFSSLAYFSYGLMYAYEEVLKETRNVMFRADFNYKFVNELPMFDIEDQLPYTTSVYRLQIAVKYAKIVGTLMFIAIGLALYSLRRIRIMRAIGTLKNDDAFRVVLKRVNSLTLDFK
jgi:hypothetical protein